eukprot:TRINITY_DN2955_c1_g1_i1.p1 TRINITY_DN2955_c1_g1~~TRINITY_DN2955_c1_g1_i1.p1  ORF type:complete len:268 (-),score=21.62 TRINITY_DN2955_c1_g1_i1:303-1106(-)
MVLASLDALSFLRGVDVAFLQAADTNTRAAVCESRIWATVVRRDTPQFVVNETLLQDCALRPIVLKCCGLLSNVIFSDKCVVRVRTASDLQQLHVKLRSAMRTRTAHIDHGGNAACVLVSDFGLSLDSPSSRFPFGLEQSLPLCGLRAGELHLKLCLEDDKVMLGAKYRERRRRGHVARRSNAVFTANISSINSPVTLSIRGACLSADGSLKKIQCGVCTTVRRHESYKGMVPSSLCIVTLMDGSPNDDDPRLANALSLDAPTNRYP